MWFPVWFEYGNLFVPWFRAWVFSWKPLWVGPPQNVDLRLEGELVVLEVSDLFLGLHVADQI